MQRIILGTRELGTSEIMAEKVAWSEIPSQVRGERTSGDGSIYLVVDLDNAKEIDRFYSKVVEGDLREGLGETKYFEIYGLISPNQISSWELKSNNPEWSLYDISVPKDSKFFIEII